MDHIVEGFVEPIRIDRYLKKIYPSLTQGLIESYLRKGKIKLFGVKIKSNHRVNDGDIISIFIDGLLEKSIDSAKINRLSTNPGVISLAEKIIGELKIYEDSNIFAINKPVNLAVQGGSKISLSVNDAINYLNYKHGYDLKLVHRLDKNTSGVLIMAKGREVALKLMNAFSQHQVNKTYLAKLSGVPKLQSGKIVSYLSKNSEGDYQKVGSNLAGKEAITFYKILDNEKENTSLVEFRPLTGRMHQLRVHAAEELGCPIVGDKKYGLAHRLYLDSEHLHLHALQLEISQDVFGEKVLISSSLPDYLKTIL